MNISISQAFRSLTVCSEKILPRCTCVGFYHFCAPGSPCAHLSMHNLCLRHSTLTSMLWMPLARLPLPAHHYFLFICCSLMPTHVLGDAPHCFPLLTSEQFITEYFLCITFKDLPLNSKLHESRELPVLFTTVYLVQHHTWHITGVNKCDEWMHCCEVKWLRAPYRERQDLMVIVSLVQITWPSTW